MPAPEKPERVPPETEASLELKSVDTSLRVKEMLAVSPILREDLLEEIVMVGIVVSMAMVRVFDARLALEDAFVKLPGSTLMLPEVLELWSGVKIA